LACSLLMMHTESIHTHKKSDFLAELPARRRRYLESRLKKTKYKAGDQIIEQGQSGHFLGIIESGKVQQENGRNRSQILSAGHYFGNEMLCYGRPSLYTLTAQTDTVIQILDRADWTAPSPRRKTIPAWVPRPNKGGWIGIISALVIIMVVTVLGPSLFEYANNTLPNRFLDRGRADLAEKYVGFAINLQPDSAKLYGNLGDILAFQDKKQEAIEAYQQAIEIDEYLPWIHNNLGVLMLEQENLELAEDYFLSALALNQYNIDINQNLGNIYYLQEKWESAADLYQKALALDFSLIDTKAAWAGLILQESRIVEAQLVWEDVILQDPRHPLALQGLGVVYLLEGDPALAMLYFDAASYFNPEDPTLHLYMGMAFEKMDRFEEAAAEYQYVTNSEADPRLVSLANALLQIVLEQ